MPILCFGHQLVSLLCWLGLRGNYEPYHCPMTLSHTHSMDGILDFIDTGDMSLMHRQEHTRVTDISWDPTGRYVVSSVSYWAEKVSKISHSCQIIHLYLFVSDGYRVYSVVISGTPLTQEPSYHGKILPVSMETTYTIFALRRRYKSRFLNRQMNECRCLVFTQ